MAIEETSMNKFSFETEESKDGLEIDNNPYFGTELQGSEQHTTCIKIMDGQWDELSWWNRINHARSWDEHEK